MCGIFSINVMFKDTYDYAEFIVILEFKHLMVIFNTPILNDDNLKFGRSRVFEEIGIYFPIFALVYIETANSPSPVTLAFAIGAGTTTRTWKVIAFSLK